MTGKAYSAIGAVFEELNKDCDYFTWSQYLIKKLREENAGACGVDMGCGNGYFTRALCKAGYSVTGMDISAEALSTAVELARKEGVKAEFLYGDIAKLSLNAKADFIVAVNDCVNYIPHGKLKTAFSRVYKNLKKNGVFIFDISSAHKLKSVIGDNIFAEDGEKFTYIWFNALRGNRVDMDITVFTALGDGKYSRADESQTQYIYEEEEITAALTECGFSVKTEGDLGKDKTLRINFICKRL